MTKLGSTHASSNSPVLSLTNLVKSFGEKQAVAGITLSVYQGEVFALLGPNGAGKSTTIQMCEGFIKPSSGSVTILGMNPATEGDAVRRQIGIMLQSGGSYSGIRVSEMLDLAASYSENPLDPEWLLDVLGLQGVRKTTYRRLSGGQQQRLSLALAIIGRPRMVFLDEPTAGLDAQSRLVVWDLISSLKRDGVTVILTTHLMDEAQALADRVAIIDRGKIITSGTTQELLTSAPGQQTAVMTTAAPLEISKIIAAIPNLAISELRPLRYRVASADLAGALSKLARVARQKNVLITSWTTDTQNLEDIFLSITGNELRS
ncbi:ABC transporter ATP-binding protein [Corynebacterium diphtheriae bv. mitis]|uniref:ABC transporter ATP-binding protein n=2 Tax=Corynebacterium diphtheriae TaxID=1717 RepID=A0A0D6GA59_CORDP|nr:ABC transporter ATP-binding protein [Corynebacterium diphtheriae]OWN08025.1 spermidine/putrescine ABC transporter ATP-binding protein [Corynebacterium belfantii]AEX46504.1 spermidine/putrescine import ATP-binding protein potA [Corynebacterium diphtheriae INCA 402]AEX48798.1 spermidine/putrescine import ATP-binding protein potA [Corynebacterium diphtheriae BH8]AEX67488.1 spermidine/putrescine import ATP-binding protein potA [Corynebacterium diphtheriae C7 (beta)]AEX69931.1 spermidine/putresc